jgi:hypothetical protein
MIKQHIFSRSIGTILIASLLVFLSCIPNISGYANNRTPKITSDILEERNTLNASPLDMHFIYNLTENLSNIIFNVYDEEYGEIAKGRAFGTKGEHKAADILYENMSSLGLYASKEQLQNIEKYPTLLHELEVIAYDVKINNKSIDSYIAPVWIGTSENKYTINYTYNYSNLKVIQPPVMPWFYLFKQHITGKLEPFVIIVKDTAFYPYYPLREFPFFDSFYFNYYVVRQLQGGLPVAYSWLWDNYLEYCKGLILYDFNEDVHDMNFLKHINHMPFIFISGNDGKKILDNIDNTRIDFQLTQQLNTSIVSYNVIGQLNGTDPTKTLIVDSLYDSWWCQGTADSAIGMSIVLAVAKYFNERNITPKYTIKFIGFSGEEHGFCAGSKYYESLHADEHILYVIDLNQLGFKQDNPKLTLNIIGNKLGFLLDIWKIIKRSDYVNRVNSSDGIALVLIKNGGPSNTGPFATSRPECKTLSFMKDGGWKLHHRDGVNHTEGDVLKYFDPEDVRVTSEIVLSIVKYLTVE